MTPEQMFERWWHGFGGDHKLQIAHLKAAFQRAFLRGYQCAKEETATAAATMIREAKAEMFGYDPFSGLHTDRDGKVVDPPGDPHA